MLKVLFLFIGIWFSIINFGNIFYKADVPPINVFLQTIGIVGFMMLHFNLI